MADLKLSDPALPFLPSGGILATDLIYVVRGDGASPETFTSYKTTVTELLAGLTESFIIAVSDETTALAAGTGKVTLRMPYAFILTEIRASLTVAQTSGSVLTVDVNDNGTTIMSAAKLKFDNGEKTTTTSGSPPALTDTALADDTEIVIDIDQVGDGTAKGLKVYLIGYKG